MPNTITTHDFTLYLHDLLIAKAQQQLEPVRLLFAEYKGVLTNFPHLQVEVDKLSAPYRARLFTVGTSAETRFTSPRKINDCFSESP